MYIVCISYTIIQVCENGKGNIILFGIQLVYFPPIKKTCDPIILASVIPIKTLLGDKFNSVGFCLIGIISNKKT